MKNSPEVRENCSKRGDDDDGRRKFPEEMRKSEYMLEGETGGGKQAARLPRQLTYLLETQLLGKCALTSDELVIHWLMGRLPQASVQPPPRILIYCSLIRRLFAY